MTIIDKSLLDEVLSGAMELPRLRMNYNFHQSLEDKCHRFLNPLEGQHGVDIPKGVWHKEMAAICYECKIFR